MNSAQEKLNNLFKDLQASPHDAFYLFKEIGKLLYQDNNFLLARDYLIKSLPYFITKDDKEEHALVLTYIINSLLALKDESALKYLYELKQTLPLIEEYKYLLLLIEYNKMFNKPYDHLIDELKGLSVNNQELIALLLERVEENSSDKVNSDITYLKIIANDDVLNKLRVFEFERLYEQKSFLELKEKLSDDILSTYYLILMEIEEDNFKIVQTLETENEKAFEKLPLKLEENLYKKLMDYYQNIDNKSKAYYENKLKNLKKTITKITKTKAPKLNVPLYKEKELEIYQNETIKEVKEGKILFLFENLFNDLSKIPYIDNKQENYRKKFLTISKYFSFSDLIFFVNNVAYHYKKERLYVKEFEKNLFELSPLGISLKDETDLILTDSELKDNYNLLTNDYFNDEVKQVLTYYLNNNNAIMFYKNSNEDLYLEDLKFKPLTEWLSYEIIQSEFILRKEETNLINENLFNNSFIIMFHLKGHFLKANKPFVDLFKITNNSLDNFLLTLDFHDMNTFNKHLESLNNKENVSFKINYLEESYLVNLFKNEFIYGILIKITNYVEEIKELNYLTKYNTISNYQTFNKFVNDFNKALNSKKTFLLISLKNYELIENIYGKNEVIKNLALELESFNKESIYEYDGSSYLISLDFNDIRTVNNFLNKLTSKDNLNIGILRYPIETKETNIDKILSYLSLAHYYAKESKSGHYYFSYETFLKDKYETEILRQIERLINSNSLKLKFRQIINLNNNKVYSYLVSLFDESLVIDSSYYEHVSKVKGKLVYLEKYLLKETLRSLNELYNKTNKYIRLTVIINEETIKDKTFNAYLIGLFKQYEIPYNLIDIIIKGSNYKKSYLNLIELTNLNINIGSNDFSLLSSDVSKIFYYEDEIKINNEKQINLIRSLKDFSLKTNLKLIFANVELEEEINVLKNLEVSYVVANKNYKMWTLAELINFILGIKK